MAVWVRISLVINVCQVSLEGLHQQHKIPHCEDVRLHEHFEIGLSVDGLVYLVLMKGLLECFELIEVP